MLSDLKSRENTQQFKEPVMKSGFMKLKDKKKEEEKVRY